MAINRVKTVVVERNGEELEWREEVSPFEDLLQAAGLLAGDRVTIAGGDLNPIEDGFPGEVGSAYFSTNGNIYKKTGLGDNDWIVFTGGGGGALYLKDLLDVDNNLNPSNNNALIFNQAAQIWKAKPICHPMVDYGLITNPVDCGHYDYGFLN